MTANIHSVNFLDVNLDLSSGEFKVYMKPNDTPLYVHSQSNHPKKVLDNIPLAVNDRLNRISANKNVFDAATPPFQEALIKSGYNHKLTFNPPEDPPVLEEGNLGAVRSPGLTHHGIQQSRPMWVNSS